MLQPLPFHLPRLLGCGYELNTIQRACPSLASPQHASPGCQSRCTMSPRTWLSGRRVRFTPLIPNTTNTMAPVSTSGLTAGFPQPVFMQGLNPDVADSFALGAAVKHRIKGGLGLMAKRRSDSLDHGKQGLFSLPFSLGTYRMPLVGPSGLELSRQPGGATHTRPW